MPQHIGHGGFSDTAILARLGAPAGASLAADVAAVKVDTAAVLVDTGDGADAAVGPGIAGSVHAHLREAQADLDTTLARIGAPAVSLVATLGTPAGASMSADVAALKAVADTINGEIGNFTADAATAVAAVQADTDDLQVRVGTPAGASLSADIAAIKADTAAVLVDTGDGADAVVAPGVAGSLHGHIREAQTDLDTALTRIGAPAVSLVATLGAPAGASLAADVAAVKVDTAAVLVDTGDGTDAAVAPAIGGSLHAHIREAQEQADTIQTEVNRLGTPVNTGGAATFAALFGDAANSALFTRIGAIIELASLVGMIGRGSDAAGTTGTAAQSLHSKLRMLMTGLGTPAVGSTVADQVAAVEGALDISGLMTLDGGFAHTTTVIQSSTLSANDLYTAQRCTVIKVVGAAGRPERTTRTVSSYDTVNRRLTLDSVLPWTPVNGDQLIVLAKLA